jgi:hypothetical protein
MIFVLIQVENKLEIDRMNVGIDASVFILEFVESWRRIPVEGLDDKKICEFLSDQGHRGLADNKPRTMVNISFMSNV